MFKVINKKAGVADIVAGISVTILCILFLTCFPAFAETPQGVILEMDAFLGSPVPNIEALPDEIEFAIYDSETATTAIAKQIFPKGKYTTELKISKSGRPTPSPLVSFRVNFSNKLTFNDKSNASDQVKGLWLDITLDGIQAGTRKQISNSTLIRLLLASKVPVSIYRNFAFGEDENPTAFSSITPTKPQDRNIDGNHTYYAYFSGMAGTGGTGTTTSTSTTTTTTSATTTTTIPSSTSALFVRNASGTEVFSVSPGGAITTASRLFTNGASAVGAAPFVLGQDIGNRGIVITDKAATNPKRIYFGWNTGASMEYVEIFALQEGVAYKNFVLAPFGGNVGMGTSSPSYPLQMGSGAYVSTGGVWTNASSREYKTDIKQLSTEKAMDALAQLKPVEFAYKADLQEKHVGFIAEDAPDIVATKDRKGMSPMDVVAVLTKVVQEQQELLREQRKIAQEQEKTIGHLSEKVAKLERRLKSKENSLSE